MKIEQAGALRIAITVEHPLREDINLSTFETWMEAVPWLAVLGADSEGGCSRLQSPSLIESFFAQFLTLQKCQPGKMMIVYSLSPENCLLVTTSFSRSVRMDNLLILHI
jgi:hypothetical protein